MTQRIDYLIQILDKIGAPLMGAVASTPSKAEGDDVTGDAQTVASLLGKVVEVSIATNESMGLNAMDAQDDALRAALAALAGPLVAGQYQKNTRVPNDNDLKRLQASVQAVLTFADNFTPSDDHAKRLEQIEANGQAMDANQVNIQYVHAFIPVINAVSAFPFGQPEQKLVMDVSGRLVKRAVEIREALMPELGGDEQKLAELSILRGLSGLYAACHNAETQRLGSMNDETPDASSMEPVWQSFDTRSAMLEAVVKNIMPGGNDGVAAVVAAAVPAAVAAPEAPKAEEAAPAVVEAPAVPTAPPAETPAPPPADSGSSGNPMAFFGAPQSDDDTPPAAPESPPAAPAAAPEVPAEQPPAAPIEPPPTPPAEAPTPPPSDGDSGDTGGSPMSFFTKKDEED